MFYGAYEEEIIDNQGHSVFQGNESKEICLATGSIYNNSSSPSIVNIYSSVFMGGSVSITIFPSQSIDLEDYPISSISVKSPNPPDIFIDFVLNVVDREYFENSFSSKLKREIQ